MPLTASLVFRSARLHYSIRGNSEQMLVILWIFEYNKADKIFVKVRTNGYH